MIKLMMSLLNKTNLTWLRMVIKLLAVGCLFLLQLTNKEFVYV